MAPHGERRGAAHTAAAGAARLYGARAGWEGLAGWKGLAWAPSRVAAC